jgi:hypothetical protein
MIESFCIVFQDCSGKDAQRKLSPFYASREAALNAAFLIGQRNCELIEIRSSEGSIMSSSDIDKALFVATA